MTRGLGRWARAVLAGTVAAAAVGCGGSTEDAGVGAPGVGASTDVAESALIEVGTGPCCLVPGEDGIWVMNHRDYSLQRVDAQTNQPDEPVLVYPYNKMIGAGDNILLEEPNAVALFDPRTREVGQPIPIAGGMRGMVFDPASDTLWVGSATGGTLTHIDADSGRALDTFTIDGLPGGGGLVFTGKSELWVAPFSGELLKVDLARERVVARLKQAPFDTGAFAVVSAGGYLWAVAPGLPTLLRINPRTLHVDRRGTVYAEGAPFPSLSAAPDGTLWLGTALDRIEQLDPETGDKLTSYRIPVADDARPDDYYAGVVTTGFGSVWTTIFNDTSYVDDALVRLKR